MTPEELPPPLRDWSLENEGFHLRIERLYKQLRYDMQRGPSRVLDWLLGAYKVASPQPQTDPATGPDDAVEAPVA